MQTRVYLALMLKQIFLRYNLDSQVQIQVFKVSACCFGNRYKLSYRMNREQVKQDTGPTGFPENLTIGGRKTVGVEPRRKMTAWRFFMMNCQQFHSRDQVIQAIIQKSSPPDPQFHVSKWLLNTDKWKNHVLSNLRLSTNTSH